jgi:hypothetical protein
MGDSGEINPAINALFTRALIDSRQLHKREGNLCPVAFAEIYRATGAEHRIPRVELMHALKKAVAFPIPGIHGHPVPDFRRERRRAGIVLSPSVLPLGDFFEESSQGHMHL